MCAATCRPAAEVNAEAEHRAALTVVAVAAVAAVVTVVSGQYGATARVGRPRAVLGRWSPAGVGDSQRLTRDVAAALADLIQAEGDDPHVSGRVR